MEERRKLRSTDVLKSVFLKTGCTAFISFRLGGGVGLAPTQCIMYYDCNRVSHQTVEWILLLIAPTDSLKMFISSSLNQLTSLASPPFTTAFLGRPFTLPPTVPASMCSPLPLVDGCQPENNLVYVDIIEYKPIRNCLTCNSWYWWWQALYLKAQRTARGHPSVQLPLQLPLSSTSALVLKIKPSPFLIVLHPCYMNMPLPCKLYSCFCMFIIAVFLFLIIFSKVIITTVQ